MSFRKQFNISVYFVLDPSLCAGRNYIDVAAAAAAGGASMVQLRDKGAGRDEVVHHANNLKQMAADFGVPFIVNDYVDVALEVDADGVHLGQDDVAPADARKMLGEDKIIGLTAFTEERIEAVDPAIVDYIGLGPFYITQTEKGKSVLGPLEAGGNGRFEELAALSRVPVVGIGGIRPENAAAVIEAGADGVAMMRSISEAEDPEGAAYAFLNVIAAARLREAS